MSDIRATLTLLESPEKLEQIKLPYTRTALSPVLSGTIIDYHFGKLYRGYVDRYNKGEGDSDFNYGGARLHNIYFAQFREPKSSNKPTGRILELINEKYGSYSAFQEEFTKAAMSLQGSNWIYLDSKGDIKVIKNHSYKDSMKIALLVDWWEHSWALDYQSDKERYLDNIWKIIDWNVCSERI